MSKIALYIAPFGLESPFDFIVPATTAVHTHLLSQTNFKLNDLVRELQKAWKSQSNLSNAQYFPEDLKWILFCPKRMTFLCRGSYNQAFLAQSSGREYGTYIVVPEIFAFKPDFLARMWELIPAQVPYITYKEALKANRHCPKGCAAGVPPAPCPHFAQQLFHTEGVNYHCFAPHTYHLAIWIPGTTLPWDVLLPSKNSDLTSYITYAIKAALTAATSNDAEQHTLNELKSLGYYPTDQNWMLIDFHTGNQIHNICVSDIPMSATTSTYIVCSVQCAPLVKKMLAVIKEHGAPGWPGFWEDLVSTQKQRV
ncbi:hypothetical protein EV426DRAFT_90949 [Tirmania nivea]|nr:hypothetical protein EV426DRAFT_90949 [Tirmania nivea]